MHVVLLGARAEAVDALCTAEHEITILYEPWEGERIARVRDRIARCCLVDSHMSTESLWSALDHLGVSSRVDAVVALGEFAVVSAAIMGRLLGARALDPAVALCCRDKAVQKAAWRAAGVPTANWLVVPDAQAHPDDVEGRVDAAGLTPPFVLKPPAGSAGRQVEVVQSAKEIRDRICGALTAPTLLIEERNEGDEWHWDGVVQGGRVTALSVSRYLAPLIETQHGHPASSIAFPPTRYPELYAEAETFTNRALAAVGLTDSVFHLEVFGSPGDFVAGELAARPGGYRTCPVAKMTNGVDLWAAASSIYTGDEIEREATDPEKVFGFTFLPAAPGRTSQLRREDIEAVPGVLEVLLSVQYGEAMPDMKVHTGAALGVVVIEGSDVEACHAVISRVVDEATRANSIPALTLRTVDAGRQLERGRI
jgi:hypothetical protein